MKTLIDWFEIPTTDFERAVGFYQQVLAVSLHPETMNGMQMAIFPHEAQPGGALVHAEFFKPSADGCVIYLYTDTLDDTLARIADAGGQTCFGPMELPNNIGRIALFIDSEGNRIGLHEPPKAA